jgi:hypothetical protein
MQHHGVARYLTRLRALDAFHRGVQVIHPQRDVAAARIAAPSPGGPARRADVTDQLDDPPVASVEVCDLQLDRVLAKQRRNVRTGFGHPAEQPQAQATTPEVHGTIEIGDGEPDMIDGAHHGAPAAACSRSGIMSRPRTSSIVSRRFTTSAVAPHTSTVAGRGRPLKFAADAS